MFPEFDELIHFAQRHDKLVSIHITKANDEYRDSDLELQENPIKIDSTEYEPLQYLALESVEDLVFNSGGR